MGNQESNVLKRVVKEVCEEDEEIVKNVKKKGNTITFDFDMIDEYRVVKIEILGDNLYEYTYDDVTEAVEEPSEEDALRQIMDDLCIVRNKRIEYYANLETPSETPADGDDRKPGFTDFESDGDEEDFEDEDEEEGESDMETPGMYDDEDKIFEESQVPQREPDWKILKPEELILTQKEQIKSVSETLFLSDSGAMVILRAYKWNSERIMNTYFQDNGKEKVLLDVGLTSDHVEFRKEGETVNLDDEFECPSCYDDIEYRETLRLNACGHRFCKDCWKEHLTVKIQDGLSKRIMCMGADCKCVVDENIVSEFITDEDVKTKYDQKLLESFVEDNLLLKWCQSAPHCGNAVMSNTRKSIAYEVQCSCKSTNSLFCFACLEEAHLPCTCKMLQAWQKKCSDDSESLNWIKSNTRDCPRCNKATFKDGGCNHVSCTCGSHWCWACGGDFTTSTVYSHNCNKYLEKDTADVNDSRASLQRYLHYFNHYNAHSTSLKNSQKIKNQIEENIKKMYQQMKMFDVEYLRKGMDVLFETRRALMYSYVFAFYLFDKRAETKSNEELKKGCRKFKDEKEREKVKNIFEDTQEQLEITTEALNKLLDLPLEKILQEATKKDIQNKSVLNEKRVHGLFDVLRAEMIVEGGSFTLPEPRYIVTIPSRGRLF